MVAVVKALWLKIGSTTKFESIFTDQSEVSTLPAGLVGFPKK